MLYLTVMLVFLCFAAIAMTVNEGLWNNTIKLFNIILAGLLGIVVGIPAGMFAFVQSGKTGEYAWYFILAGIWGVFAISVLLFGMAAKAASGVRMRFIPMLDNIAGPLMGMMVAIMLTSFTAYTLERVPIKAGEWNLGAAESWQKTSFKYARAPFRNVLIKFVEAEGANNSFYDDIRSKK
jgi:hypothetical protein